MKKNKPTSNRFRAGTKQWEYIKQHERINEEKNRQDNKRNN